MIESTGTNTRSKLLSFTILVVLSVLVTACGSPTSEVQTPAETSIATSESPASNSDLASATPASGDLTVAVEASFSKDILPIFTAKCVNCHGVEKINRGLDLTSYDKTMAGSVKGPVISTGDAESSTLFKLVLEGKMPKRGGKLTAEQITLIKEWINAGAQNN
jgi:mono/diheme cytochrome c family protein